VCARFTLRTSTDAVSRLFGAARAPKVGPRYNVAPGQLILAARSLESGEVVIDSLRFGIESARTESTAKTPRREEERQGPLLVNARAETVFSRPAFRAAARRRRCLVPADGFYEWRADGKRKEPFLFRLRDGGLFAFAAIFEAGAAEDGSVVEGAALLTCAPNELVRPIHDRMPVIVRPADSPLWLDRAVSDPARLAPILAPLEAAAMVRDPANPRVNDARNDDPGCIEPPSERQLELGLG